MIFHRFTLLSQTCLVLSWSMLLAFFVVNIMDVSSIIHHTSNLELFNLILIGVVLPLKLVYVLEYLRIQDRDHHDSLMQIQNKNTYLEHAAKILRHDMHSGINTYIPRAVKSIERRLEKRPDVIRELALEAPLNMLKDGLAHTQKVYQGVTEFTNLVKDGNQITKRPCNLRDSLVDYLSTTSYRDQVVIDFLPTVEINSPLFCTAIDNLIRNGLTYNDSDTKLVVISMFDDHTLSIKDNGRGMSQEEFELYSKAYTRKGGQKEKGTGLGLNICIAILQEHGFSVTCKRGEEGGTDIRVRVR